MTGLNFEGAVGEYAGIGLAVDGDAELLSGFVGYFGSGCGGLDVAIAVDEGDAVVWDFGNIFGGECLAELNFLLKCLVKRLGEEVARTELGT